MISSNDNKDRVQGKIKKKWKSIFDITFTRNRLNDIKDIKMITYQSYQTLYKVAFASIYNFSIEKESSQMLPSFEPCQIS